MIRINMAAVLWMIVMLALSISATPWPVTLIIFALIIIVCVCIHFYDTYTSKQFNERVAHEEELERQYVEMYGPINKENDEEFDKFYEWLKNKLKEEGYED